MAQACTLYGFKVLDNRGNGDDSGIIKARDKVAEIKARALAVTAPLIGASGAIWIDHLRTGDPVTLWPGLMPFSVFLLAYGLSELPPGIPWTDSVRLPPRAPDPAPDSGWLDTLGWYPGTLFIRRWLVIRWRAVAVLYAVPAAIALTYPPPGDRMPAAAAVAGGVVVGALAGRAWYRMLQTYLRFIVQAKAAVQAKASRSAVSG
jgi:hypothetical protein